MAYESDYRPIDTLISNTSDNGTYTSDYTPITPGLAPEQQGALDRNMEIVKQAVPQAMEAASVRRRSPKTMFDKALDYAGGYVDTLDALNQTSKGLVGGALAFLPSKGAKLWKLGESKLLGYSPQESVNRARKAEEWMNEKIQFQPDNPRAQGAIETISKYLMDPVFGTFREIGQLPGESWNMPVMREAGGDIAEVTAPLSIHKIARPIKTEIQTRFRGRTPVQAEPPPPIQQAKPMVPREDIFKPPEPEVGLTTITPEDTVKSRKKLPGITGITGVEDTPFGTIISDSIKAEREAAKVRAKEEKAAERRRLSEEKKAAKQQAIIDKQKAKESPGVTEAIDEAQKIVEAVEPPTPENVEQKPLSRRAAKAAEKEEAAELRAIYENELKGYNLTPEGFAESMNDFDNLPIQAKRGRVESLYTPDPETAPTPEEITKAQEMWNIAQEAGRKQQEKMADIELLKEAGYSERQIADMTEDSLANAIRKVKRRDTTSLVTDEEMETLSGFEQVISDAIERAANGEVIPEGELIEIMKMSQAINVHPITEISGRPMPGKIITYEQLKRTREGLRTAAKRKERAQQIVQAEAKNLTRQLKPKGDSQAKLESIQKRVDETYKKLKNLPDSIELDRLFDERLKLTTADPNQPLSSFFNNPERDAKVKALNEKIDELSRRVYTSPEALAFGEANKAKTEFENIAVFERQKVYDDSVRGNWDKVAWHGTGIEELPEILSKGLNPGSALDFTPTKGWASEYPISVIVPSAKKGMKIEHNDYYKSSNTARVAKVIVDLEQYTEEAVGGVRSEIIKLSKQHPDVEFEIKGEPPLNVPTKTIRRRGGGTTEIVKTAKDTENLGAKRRQRQKDTVENEREAALKKMIEEQEADRRAQEEGGTGLEEESIEDLRRREESGEGQGYGAYNWEDRSQTMTPEQRLARKAQDLATYAKNLREGGLPNEDFYKVQIAANKMMREYADKVVRGEAMTPAEIRTYAVAIYKVIPQNAADMAFLRRAYQTIEADLAKIPGHVDSFKLADVSEADKTLQIHGDETRMVNSVLRALRSDPTFKFEVNRLTGIDPRAERTVLGSYNFAQNLVKLHDPTSMAHEVVHWSFWNVLTPRERAAYMDYYFKTFFDEQGRPKFDEMVNATSNALDALGGPTEMFATLGHDYYANRVMSMTERSLFQRVKDWWNNFIANPELKALKPRFDEVSKLFDRVWMKDTRITRTGGARMIDTIPASERAIMVNGELKRAGEFVKEVTTPPRREPTDIRNSVTLDMLGLQSMYERAAEIWKNARRYHQIKGSQIAAEVKGPDGKERVVTVMRNPKDERSIPLFKQWLYTQPALFEGTPVEPYWFRLNAHDLYWQFNHDQNRMHLHNAYRMLGNDQERINSIRGVLEGKNKNPDPELAQAALEVKQWLEGMKGRVKNHLIDSYKKQLHGDEYNALLDLIAGKDIIDVTKKYPKVDGETLLEINKNYNKIDKWGIDDYVPNYEFGQMKIMMKDPESGQMKIVAIGLSERDAIRKSVKYLNEHPDYAGNLFVDTSASQFFDKTGVSAKHYYSMLGAFERSMKKSIENIDAGVRKQIARKVVSQKYIIDPTHKYSPYLEERRGRLQGEEDLQKLLNHYSYSIEKKLALDPIIDDIRTAISFNKFDKSQVAAITDLISDVKGKYWVADQIVDGILKWGGQKVAGITGLDFGIDPHGSFSKITKRGRQFEANVKLGYRPVAAFVNLASGQMHTWTKVGTKYYTEAAKFLLTPEGRAFIEKVEPYLGVSLVEEMNPKFKESMSLSSDKKVHTKEPLWKPLGMFQRPEFLNRKVATAAMYLMEKATGASELAAMESAIRANWMTQFTYNMASLPKIMRGPTGKMVFQFMPYLANEIRFMANLSPFEWFKYLSWQTALSGPRGLILTAKTLPLLAVCGWYQDMMDDAESWMNTHTPNLFRGAMGAVSKAFGPEWAPDISGPASMQFPGGMGGQFGGPLIQDMIVLFSDFMKGMPLALNADRQLETTPAALDWRTGTGKVVPVFRHWAGIWDYFIDKNHHVLDTRYNNLYSLPDLPNPEAAGHIANKLFAADSIRESAEKTMERIEYRKRSKEKMRKAELGNKIQYDIMREGKISDNSMRKASELGVDPSRAVEEGMIQSAVPMYRRRQVGEDIRQFIRRQESEPEFIGEED